MNLSAKLLAVAAGFFLMATTGLAQSASPASSSAASQGAVLFHHRCVFCHGVDGTGNTAPGRAFKVIDFHNSAVMKMSDADLSAIIHNGKNKMPAFGSRLSADDIQNAIAYIRTLQKK